MTSQKQDELPADVMKIFLKAEKAFREYKNCEPSQGSKKWFSVITAFDDVLGLMDTIGDYISSATQQAVKEEREKCELEFLEMGKLDLTGTARTPEEYSENMKKFIQEQIESHKRAIEYLESLSPSKEGGK